jgi:hypothetical protein
MLVFLFTLSGAGLRAAGQTNGPSSVVTNASQAALEAALASGAPVTFGFDGIIGLTNSILVTTNTTLDASGRQITLDGQNAVRHFVVTNGVTLRLVNLTLANGWLMGNQGQTNKNGEPAFGGSIYNGGGILELVGCTLTNNQVIGGKGGPPAPSPPYPPGLPPFTRAGDAWGGAIYSTNGEIRMTNCLVAGNICQGGFGAPDQLTVEYGGNAAGGALCSLNGVISLTGVTFTGNMARTGEVGATSGFGSPNGGAVYEAGTLTVSDCVFVSNRAFCATNHLGSGRASGGAIVQASGTAQIRRTSFILNKATGGPTVNLLPDVWIVSDAYGGAIVSGFTSTLELSDSAFVLNEASGGLEPVSVQQSAGGSGYAGAITGGNLIITNCTFAQNRATSGAGGAPGTWSGGAAGGAIILSGTNSFVNVTFADNSVQGESAVGSSLSLGGTASFPNRTTLVNTILSCEPGQTNIDARSGDPHTSLTDGGHNLCSDGSANFTSPTSRSNLDPRLGPWTDNGGPTPTVALLPDSPAIDAGDDSECPPADQRGVPRPQGLHCDIGAFELAPTLTLARAPDGVVTLDYQFRAGGTNEVSASTNLTSWLLLGARVSDTNGMFRLQDPDAGQLPRRFYKVWPQQ